MHPPDAPRHDPDVLLNLVVIRSADLDRSESFYRTLGLTFTRHRHGAGPEHLSCELGPLVFEVYPRVASPAESSGSTGGGSPSPPGSAFRCRPWTRRSGGYRQSAQPSCRRRKTRRGAGGR